MLVVVKYLITTRYKLSSEFILLTYTEIWIVVEFWNFKSSIESWEEQRCWNWKSETYIPFMLMVNDVAMEGDK
jgi:hypothetical protein